MDISVETFCWTKMTKEENQMKDLILQKYENKEIIHILITFGTIPKRGTDVGIDHKNLLVR